LACNEKPSMSAHSDPGSGAGRGERRWPRRAMGREDSGASATPPWIDAAGVEEREPARNSCGRTARGRSAQER
jgi:hypothetical protein